MRKLTVIGVSVAVLALVVTILGLWPGNIKAAKDYDVLHEVAHPRAVIVNNTTGAAENFAHGGLIGDAHILDKPDTSVVHLRILQGETVRFKSGFGYEGIWFANASGTLSTSIEVFLRQGDSWVAYKSDKKEDTATGPKIVKGSVVVDVPFPQVGTFPVRNKLRTVAQPAGGAAVVDEDEVLVNVMVMDPAKMVSISGRVEMEDSGRPHVEKAKVVAIDAATGKAAGTAVTEDNGKYEITRLPAGKYVVRAHKDDGSLVPEFYKDVYFRAKATVLDIPEGGKLKDIDFVLGPGGRISGKVTGPGGKAIAGASVAFRRDASEGWFYAATKEDGSYLSSPLPAGKYVVRVAAKGFITEFFDNVLAIDQATPVQVNAGATATVNTELAIGGRISGKVTGPGGAPVEGVSVAFRLEGSEMWLSGKSLDDGSYLSPLLVPGKYAIRAAAPGYVTEFYDNVPKVEDATAVQVNASATATVNMELSPVPK